MFALLHCLPAWAAGVILKDWRRRMARALRPENIFEKFLRECHCHLALMLQLTTNQLRKALQFFYGIFLGIVPISSYRIYIPIETVHNIWSANNFWRHLLQLTAPPQPTYALNRIPFVLSFNLIGLLDVIRSFHESTSASKTYRISSAF